MSKTPFSQKILTWFDQHGRTHLPWQQNRTAYRVWASEIMLQQTQVSTVIPYYQRFMERFPTVEALAKAPQDEVLSLWTGLGYYARARNLHKCAQTVVEHYQHEFPNTVEELAALPGIGRSTAGAIMSLAFNLRAPILDGNVKRTLARYHGVAGWPGKTAVADQLWAHAEKHTPDKRNDDYTQAMMDIGATLCTRAKPDCQSCPLRGDCYALEHDVISELPGKKPKKIKPVKPVQMLVICHDKQLLLSQRPPTGIWGGLWSFPEIPSDTDAKNHCEAHYGQVDTVQNWAEHRHTFSHYHLDITPVVIHLKSPLLSIADNNQQWFKQGADNTVGLPAPVKKLLDKCYSALK